MDPVSSSLTTCNVLTQRYRGFSGAMPQDKIALCAFFDNEEVGSGTKQGADSDFLEVTLERLCMALGLDAQERYCIYSNSLLLSADNAHALPSKPSGKM